MAKRQLPSPEVLRQLLRYEPETGKLFWAVNHTQKAWAGKEALWDHFRALKVCLPPLEEQDRILSEIDTETARIDGLITLTECSIDLLREKRAALITAAVTGKIDVRASA